MISHRSLVLALLFSTSYTLTACGSGGGGDIALDDLGTEIGEELCDHLTACGQFPDVASCRASTDFSVDQLIADEAAGLVDFDGGKARECINALRNNDCTLFGQFEEDDACDATFSGSVVLGGACFNSEVCAGDARCNGDETETCRPGTCVALEAVAGEGESCLDANCADGLDCNDSDVCVASPGPGDTCSSLSDCTNDSLCQLGADNTPGTCVALPSSGGTCDPNLGGEILGGRFSCLLVTDYCDPSDNTCKAKLLDGGDCSAVPYACINYAQCIEGACVAAPGIGDSCVVDGQPDCLGDLECDGGTCALAPAPAVCSL